MPYTIDYSEAGKTAIIVNDGTLDTSTSIKLIGKNYQRFGEILNEDLLHLLENFASVDEPVNPTEGQLWYDTGDSQLMIYDNGRWYPICNPVGGTSGMFIRYRYDTSDVGHYTLEHVVDENIVTIMVDDTTAWVPRADEYLEDGTTALTTQFPTIQAGINMNTTSEYKFRGTATSADYADLAERYAADKQYEPGTVVRLGGTHEVTQVLQLADIDVFGVVSDRPGFEMNSNAGTNITHPYIALAGRVPCKVVGKVAKGDRLVSSDTPGHAQKASENDAADYRKVIGRALHGKDDVASGIVEIVVGAK
jgi:hypothetical protein